MSLSLTRIEPEAIIALPSATAKFFSSLELAHGGFVTDALTNLVVFSVPPEDVTAWQILKLTGLDDSEWANF